MEHHHAIQGKTHYFDWAMFNRFLYVYQAGYPIKSPLKSHEKSPFSIIFQPFSIAMLVYQRVYPINIPLNHYKITIFNSFFYVSQAG